MCMLNRRVQVLVNKDILNKLSELSKAQKVSMGEVVRRAVEKEYDEQKDLEVRKKAIDATLMNRLLYKGKIDYKELINYGRKY